MSDTSYSDNPELAFLDDEPTDPQVSLSALQRELDGAVSLAEGFVTRGRSLGYDGNSVDAPVPAWMRRLDEELDGAENVDGIEVDA